MLFKNSESSDNHENSTREIKSFLSEQDRAKVAELAKDPKELALISGAGIAGLTTTFELLAKGFNVVVVEQRSAFDRFNVINIDVEAQRFLAKHGLLEDFEKEVAAKIKTHNIVHYRNDGFKILGSNDVSTLKLTNVSFEAESLDQLFNSDGLYSVKISDLQTFLAKKALERGAHIFYNVQVKKTTYREGVGIYNVHIKGVDIIDSEIDGFDSTVLGEEVLSGSKVKIIRKEETILGKHIFYDYMLLQPSLFFVAEGAHCSQGYTYGAMNRDDEVINACTGESWIFGNVKYFGQENFVVSMIDTSAGGLEIANVIFNSKIGEVNIAVTSKNKLSQELIQERILMIAERVFSLVKSGAISHIGAIPRIGDKPQLIVTVKHPVQIRNIQCGTYSQGNIFCIGDAAGHSSPLAGLGGTLCLTLFPYAVQKLLENRVQQPHMMHDTYNKHLYAYTSKWIEKSQNVKTFCIKTAKDNSHLNTKDDSCLNTIRAMLPAYSRSKAIAATTVFGLAAFTVARYMTQDNDNACTLKLDMG